MHAGITFRQIEAFYWIARCGSFSEAARSLNATQPGISNRIRELETLLNVRLFERGGRGVALTPAGRELQGLAEQIVSLGHDFLARSGSQAGVGGVVRIGAADTVALTWLPRLMAELGTRYPRLAVELTVDLSVHLRDRLVEGELDVAFMVGGAPGPEFEEIPLGRISNAWMAPRAFGLGGRRIGAEELARHTILTHSRGSHLHRIVRQWFAEAGIRNIRIHGCNSLATMIEMTIAGLGVSLLSPALVRQRHGDLLDILDVGRPVAPTHFACVHAAQGPGAVHGAIIEIARREIAREPCFEA